MISRRNILAGIAVSVLSSQSLAHASNFPFRLRNNRLFVKTRVNGLPMHALLDSGAEMTLIDRAVADRLLLPSVRPITIRGSGAGSQQAEMVSGATIDLLGLSLRPDVVVATDLTDVSQRLSNEPILLIVGRDIFDATPIKIDFANSVIIVLDRVPSGSGVELPLKTEHGIETMPVLIDGHPAQGSFDLGNGSRPVVSASFCERHGLMSKQLNKSVRGGGIGGETSLPLIKLDSVVLAQRRFDNVEFAVTDRKNASDVNIGVSLLRQFTITVDMRRHAIWLS